MGEYNNQDNQPDNQAQSNGDNSDQAPQHQQPQYQSPQDQQPQPQYQQPQQQYQQPQPQQQYQQDQQSQQYQQQYQQTPYQQPVQPDYQYQQQYQQYPNNEEKPKQGMSIAALVLGIVSVVCSCIWYLAIPAGVVGLVLGIISLRGKKDGRGMAIAGTILSGIGIIASLIIIISAVTILHEAGGDFDSWYNQLKNDLY